MPLRQEAIRTGDRELRRTARRFADDFRELRLRAGVSQSAVSAAIGVDRSVICRLERGDEGISLEIRARACACLGADFRLQLYPERTPMLFDLAHARISDRLIAVSHPMWGATIEAHVPGPGRRSVDLLLARGDDVVLVEIETRLRRFEEILRELHGKRDGVRDSVPGRRVHVVLALPPTRHHQLLVRALPGAIRAALPTPPALLARALASSEEVWPGDGILWIAGDAGPRGRDGASLRDAQRSDGIESRARAARPSRGLHRD
jgi:transcriptional regulator with XRE-family HTH domain